MESFKENGNEKPAASTGPRPRGRGNWPQPLPACSSRARFNGAAPARARKCIVVLTFGSLIDLLQRGRARAGAEMRRSDRLFTLARMCFNGAAPARARKLGLLNFNRRTAQRFNGAAPARARKCAISAQKAGAHIASTGPRPRGRGNLGDILIMPVLMLRFNGAAPARARKSGQRHQARGKFLASTGPRPRGRGNYTEPDTSLSSGAVLQRGRARAGAEIC